MGTVYQAYDGYEPSWPATGDNPEADLPRYQVAHTANEGDWQGAPTASGIWYVSSKGLPSKQDVIDYLDPPEVRAERNRQKTFRLDSRRSDMLTLMQTGTASDVEDLIDSIEDLEGAKALLLKIIFAVALDYRT